MAVPKIQAPELIGRVRGAERNVRYIPTNRGRDLMELGRSVQQLGNTALKGLDMVAGWTDEKHRANYIKSYAEAEAEAERRYLEEVENQPGFNAEGASQRAQQIYAEVGAKYRPQIGGRYQEQFDAAWTRLSGSQNRRAFAFEQRNLRSASIETDKAIIGRAVEGVATSMDPEIQGSYFSEIKESYDRLYLTQNGGKRLPGETLKEFDADVEKGFLKTRSGKNLRITEGEEGEGTISKKRVAELRTRWENRDKVYKQGLEKLYDQAHANVIDRLLKDDRVQEAEEYLLRIGDDAPVSSKTMTLLTKAVETKTEVLEAKSEAEKLITGTTAEAANPRYNSVEQDAAFAERFKDLPDKAKPFAMQKWRELSRERDANLQLDLYNFSKDNLQTTDQNGKPVALPLSKQEEKIKAVTDPTLKEELLKIHKKKVIAQENEYNASPEYIVYADGALSQFSRDLARGYAEVDGKKMPLETKEQQMLHVRSLGLTSKYQKKATEYIKDSANMVSADEVENVLKKAFSGAELDEDAIAKYVPFIQRVVEDRRGTLPLGGKTDRAKWIKEQVEDVLTIELEKRREFIWDENLSVKTAITANADPAKLYFDEDNFEKFREKQNRAWKLRGADTTRREKPDFYNGRKQLKNQGLQPKRNGKYYLLGDEN